MDKWQLIYSLNEIDADYITEYESLSSFMAAKKMIRRRRIRIASRVAACLAIVGTGVLLTVHDINNGLIGNTKNEELGASADKIFIMPGSNSEDILKENGHSSVAPGAPGATNGDVNDSANATNMVISCEEISCTAPMHDIVVTVVDAGLSSLTLKFTVPAEKAGKWYTGPGVVIFDLDAAEPDMYFNNYGEATDYLMKFDENGVCTVTYEWAASIGALSKGHFMIKTLLADKNTRYEVNTTVQVYR